MKEFRYFVNDVEYETLSAAEMAVYAYVEVTYADESYYDGEYGDDLFNEYQNQITVKDEEGNTYSYDEFFQLQLDGTKI